MKKLPKRVCAKRIRIHRGRSTVDIMRAALARQIAIALANIGETEDCAIQIVERGRTRKPRIAILPKRDRQNASPLLEAPLLASRGKG